MCVVCLLKFLSLLFSAQIVRQSCYGSLVAAAPYLVAQSCHTPSHSPQSPPLFLLMTILEFIWLFIPPITVSISLGSGAGLAPRSVHPGHINGPPSAHTSYPGRLTPGSVCSVCSTCPVSSLSFVSLFIGLLPGVLSLRRLEGPLY